MSAILLIDDKEGQVNELRDAVTRELNGDGEVRTWVPTGEQADARTTFGEKIGTDTGLVVTDYDLTSRGQTGLFGSTIVAWCQQRALPVADYSRANPNQLPKYPDLFELRVPPNGEPAKFIAAVHRGFRRIKDVISGNEEFSKARSAAAVLSVILGEPEVEGDFALYALRIGAASGALMTTVTSTAPDNIEPSANDIRSVLAFIVGHLLLNAVLRFPGPILSLNALAGYLGTDSVTDEELQALFERARYDGPFCELDQYYWLAGVDRVLDEIVPTDVTTDTVGELHRIGLEKRLGHELARHGCKRCNGQNGGYFCPLTRRTVCLRPDCSVGSNSWIPQGARLCRIERDFFEEWAPVLGL